VRKGTVEIRKRGTKKGNQSWDDSQGVRHASARNRKKAKPVKKGKRGEVKRKKRSIRLLGFRTSPGNSKKNQNGGENGGGVRKKCSMFSCRRGENPKKPPPAIRKNWGGVKKKKTQGVTRPTDLPNQMHGILVGNS